jgi:hypothetical protein
MICKFKNNLQTEPEAEGRARNINLDRKTK